MGGSDKGSAASSTASQQLLDEFKRQQTASQIQGAFNQFAKGVGTQLPPFQQAQGGMPQASGQAQGPPQIPALAGLSQLFPGQGMGGAGGIDEQQLAMILQRLGYGGQV